jgi:predicted ATPase
METTEFIELIRELLAKEFKSMDCRVYKDACDRTNIAQNDISAVIRIITSEVRYYLCVVVSEEVIEDTPSDKLPIKIRDFVKKVILHFSPERYAAPIDGKSCEKWVLTNYGMIRP